MWLSKQTAAAGARREGTADFGVVTIGGARPAVYSGEERRQVLVYAPGGYCWRPSVGDGVLVLKAGDEGEQPCIVGAQTKPEAELAPGEVFLYSNGGASILLAADGTVRITGPVQISGSLQIGGKLYVEGKQYKPCTCGEMGG